jgi:hypothetical protein
MYAGLIISTTVMFGQEIPELKVTAKDMTGVIFREMGDSESIVEVQSNVPLTFESTMDKEVNIYNTKEENGFFFYYLKFPIVDKHKGRKLQLKIKSHGYQYHYEPLDLKAKVPVGLYVDDNKTELQGHKVAVKRFANETAYARGVFYDKENDPIAKQAVTVLSTKLAQTKKFSLLEWNKNQEEWQIADYQRLGTDYLIMGTITEFGRKNERMKKKKYQIVQTSISIRLIDVATGLIVYAKEEKGEAKTDGTATDYDATLSDKAISDAISKLVNNINNFISIKK